jgi:hypothetical protein
MSDVRPECTDERVCPRHDSDCADTHLCCRNCPLHEERRGYLTGQLVVVHDTTAALERYEVNASDFDGSVVIVYPTEAEAKRGVIFNRDPYRHITYGPFDHDGKPAILVMLKAPTIEEAA